MGNCVQNYTPKQESAINKLSARVVRYQMHIDQINNDIAKNPGMQFDEYTDLREKLKMYENQKDKANAEIAEIEKQGELYRKHLKAAKYHLDESEKIKKRWLE